MRRREFLTAVSGAALAWPLVARAQQPAIPVVGVLEAGSTAPNPSSTPAFAAGLAETGYVEGRNVSVLRRSARGNYERLQALAAELADARVAVIYAIANVASDAAKAATSEIPIVFSTGNDPVETGLVPSLNRPSGNVTGVSFVADALPVKRLELLHEMVPAAKIVAMLVNPNNANSRSDPPQVEAAARSLGLRLLVTAAASDSEIETAFAKMDEEGANGLLVNPDAFLASRRESVVAMAAQHELPAIYSFRGYIEAGGLMRYGGSDDEVFRLAGLYVGRILSGAKPADLPVVQSTKTDLVVNLKTAKALGLTVPQSILARADEVIE